MCGNIITTRLCVDCGKEHSKGKEAILCADALRYDEPEFGKGCLLDRDIKLDKRRGRCTRCKEKEERRLFEEETRRENEEAKRQRERREEEERRAREKGDDDFGSYYSVMYARR